MKGAGPDCLLILRQMNEELALVGMRHRSIGRGEWRFNLRSGWRSRRSGSRRRILILSDEKSGRAETQNTEERKLCQKTSQRQLSTLLLSATEMNQNSECAAPYLRSFVMTKDSLQRTHDVVNILFRHSSRQRQRH